ncbi:hypothetical protein N5E96_02720 [Pseudomonas mosselii]|uniref:hypothetical protein n=1 Tax=Pseudomonas mosselii TaxID=78327 RepID=UPI00209BF066|nr:hypothetical protein [Pseudomonas mosselii]MDH1656747.1 hypothetical protein [Pseudomonas mosselii]MDH1715512.1 hypothetical protein [Pseudomonas mosselii]MDH1720203.1 hypothetical protein [Pseudomonas mosselii]
MTKNISVRLQKNIDKISSWGTSNFPAREHLIIDYTNGTGNFHKASQQLFAIGMTELGSTLASATINQHFATRMEFSNAIIKMLTADTIRTHKLKTTQELGLATLDDLTHLMLCTLACGQFNLIHPVHQTVFEGLGHGYGVSDGHDLPIGTTLRYAAFGLAIIGDWLGKPLDLDKHALPRDPAWGQLVAHWREPDPDKLLPILMAACDTHVERIALNSRELDSGNFEFGSPFEAVYPAEILAILNLRRSLKLTNPFIDHPLMTTPYAALTCPPGTRLDKDELLERFLIAVCKYNPEAMPEGLYEAVLQKPPLS